MSLMLCLHRSATPTIPAHAELLSKALSDEANASDFAGSTAATTTAEDIYNNSFQTMNTDASESAQILPSLPTSPGQPAIPWMLHLRSGIIMEKRESAPDELHVERLFPAKHPDDPFSGLASAERKVTAQLLFACDFAAGSEGAGDMGVGGDRVVCFVDATPGRSSGATSTSTSTSTSMTATTGTRTDVEAECPVHVLDWTTVLDRRTALALGMGSRYQGGVIRSGRCTVTCDQDGDPVKCDFDTQVGPR